MPLPETILFFDDHCLLCQHSVQWLLQKDKQGILHFAPQNGVTISNASAEFSSPPLQKEGVILLHQGKWYARSDASLLAVSLLEAPVKYLSLLHWFPAGLRNLVYNIIARYRYSLFGKTNQCFLPSPQWASRMLP